MPSVQIITDSTCCLPAPVWARYDIPRIPTSIVIDGQPFADDGRIERRWFFQRLEAGASPHTSQATPAQFAEIFRARATQGPILVLTITSKGSGTFQAAKAAAEEVPEADVVVWDSLSFSAGLGFQVWAAADMAAAGADRATILAHLERRRAASWVSLTPATLKYLQRSGRVSLLQGTLATILDIKPIIVLRAGVMEPRERVRGRRRALQRLVALGAGAVSPRAPVWACVAHAEAHAEAEVLARAVQNTFQCERFFISELPLSLVVHGGPGIIGVILSPATLDGSKE